MDTRDVEGPPSVTIWVLTSFRMHSKFWRGRNMLCLVRGLPPAATVTTPPRAYYGEPADESGYDRTFQPVPFNKYLDLAKFWCPKKIPFKCVNLSTLAAASTSIRRAL